MVTAAKLRALCLALADTTEVPHMDRAAFRTRQRIYATLAADEESANLKLTVEQQELLCAAKPKAFAPVAGGWGRMGWTTVTLAAADVASLTDALAWAHAIASVKKRKR